MTSPSQPTSPAATSGAAEAVAHLRDALVAGDVERAQSHRWLKPRPPGERDLLSDLAAAEGVAPAVRQLSKFWSRADVYLEHIRVIDEHEVEVYERLVLPGENLPIMSLVRREAAGRPWGVVCTNEALDERFRLWISVDSDSIDDAAWSRAFPEPGDLLMTDDGGVLGHNELGWLVHVRGPYVPGEWPEGLPGESHLVELAVALAAVPQDRREQLRWMLAAACTTLDQLGGHGAYRPAEKKLLLPDMLKRAAAAELAPREALYFWASMKESNGFVLTEGLHLLGLPEVEAEIEVIGDAERTRRIVEWIATTMVGARQMPAAGTELVIGERSLVLAPGRRGPRRGASYGRWGALRVREIVGKLARGSRTRMRVPPDVVG